MGLVKAVVVGWHFGSQELLHRRVGGILKGIADVSVCRNEEALEHMNVQLIITYAYGEKLKDMLRQKLKSSVKLVGVELTLLPTGIRTLQMVDTSVRLGVIAEHRRCANYFFSEIVRAGIMDHNFFVGTFEDMPYMPVDQFVVSEEMVDRVPKEVDTKKVISVPRAITSASTAEIIRSALEIAVSSGIKM